MPGILNQAMGVGGNPVWQLLVAGREAEARRLYGDEAVEAALLSRTDRQEPQRAILRSEDRGRVLPPTELPNVYRGPLGPTLDDLERERRLRSRGRPAARGRGI